MPTSIATSALSKPVKTIDSDEPRALPRPEMARVVKAALQQHYGSMKAAALSMAIDQGQLTRELDSGAFKFWRLDKLEDEGRAAVARALFEAYGLDDNPRAKLKRLIHEQRARLDEIEALVPEVA